jgi:hypothetical protein
MILRYDLHSTIKKLRKSLFTWLNVPGAGIEPAKWQAGPHSRNGLLDAYTDVSQFLTN